MHKEKGKIIPFVPTEKQVKKHLAKPADPETEWYCRLYDLISEGHGHGWVDDKFLNMFVGLVMDKGISHE